MESMINLDINLQYLENRFQKFSAPLKIKKLEKDNTIEFYSAKITLNESTTIDDVIQCQYSIQYKRFQDYENTVYNVKISLKPVSLHRSFHG